MCLEYNCLHVHGMQLFTCVWNTIVYMCVECNRLHVRAMQLFTCAWNAIVYMCMECNVYSFLLALFPGLPAVQF